MRASWPLPAVLAHRCGGLLAPENTLAGLNAAAACGCRGIEFDVMLSADGEAVLIHDETLERTTDGHGEVARTPLATLLALDAGSWFHPDFAGERVPTLAAALERCVTLGLAANVEIKPAAGYEHETGRVVAGILRSAQSLPGLVMSSFSEAALASATEVFPEARYGLLLDGLLPDWRERAARTAVSAIHANSARLGADDVLAVRRAGYRLAVYTENDAARVRALRACGVDSVITDRPDLVREAGMGKQ